MTVEKVLGGFFLATEMIKDGAGNVIKVEAVCLPDRAEAEKQCDKQCKEFAGGSA